MQKQGLSKNENPDIYDKYNNLKNTCKVSSCNNLNKNAVCLFSWKSKAFPWETKNSNIDLS